MDELVTMMDYDLVVPDKICFRAYDIRGPYPNILNENMAYTLGRSFGAQALSKGHLDICVGRDGRLSGPILLTALMQGLCDAGCNVIHVGLVPSPLLYFSTHYFKTGSGIVVTGSHNPAQDNGFKMMLGGRTLSTAAIQELYARIEKGDLPKAAEMGDKIDEDILASYVDAALSSVTIERPVRVVIDTGNGAAGPVMKALVKRLPGHFTCIHTDIDGSFPNHHPDPSKAENLADLIAAVQSEGAEVGLAFDGDGDRLGVVTASGKIIYPDQILQLYAADVCKRHPNATVIFDVKCSKHLPALIESLGGKPIMSKTGHAFLKEALRAHQAELAGEMSGHFFFNDDWYGFDDAPFAALRLLALIAKHDHADELFKVLPESITTPELNISLADDKKFKWVEDFIKQSDFADATLVTLDGLRVEWSDAWALIRASNTTPNLVLRFEADSAEAMIQAQKKFAQAILSFDPGIKLPFDHLAP